MRKRIGSLVLTLCMVLALIPAAAVPVRAEGEQTVTTFDDLKSVFDGASTDKNSPTEIKLGADIDTTEGLTVANGKYVVLDLAGHTIKRTSGNGYVIGVSGGSLTLKDSGNGGKITGGNRSDGYGGGAYVLNGGTFKMTGGTITGNSAQYGGGVAVYDGTFEMTGGRITGNSAYRSGNNSYDGGGVYVAGNGIFKLSGSPVISGNYKNGTLDANGVYTQGSGTSNNAYVTSNSKLQVTGKLTDSASIYMSTGLGNVFTSSTDVSLNDASKFHYDDGGTYEITQDVNGQLLVVQFTSVSTWDDLRTKLANSGRYRLTDNVTYSSGDHLSVPADKTVILDLAGYKIDINQQNKIGIKVEGTLVLNDSSVGKTGQITGSKRTTETNGCGVLVDGDGAVFTMNSGKISGNGTTGKPGGGVYVNVGTFNMNGGEISGNYTAKDGGGVYVSNAGIFNMNGGTITGNSTNQNGGGVFVAFSSSNQHRFNISGDVTISGNVKGGSKADGATVYSGGDADNVYLLNNSTAANSGHITVTGPLTGDGKIGVAVSSPASYAQITNTESGDLDYNVASKFESDNSTYTVYKNDDGQLELAAPMTWSSVQTAMNSAGGGTIKLTNSITATNGDNALQVPANKTVILDLNGFTIDRGLTSETAVENGYVIGVLGTLTLKDSSAAKTGKITGGNSTTNAGGVFMSSNATFNMEGGTITGNATSQCGGGVYVTANGVFNMSGGSITGNKISGTEATNQGGGVYVIGTFRVSGGATITGNVKGGTTYSSYAYTGDTANNVYLFGSNKITIGGPLTGSIGVVGGGTDFTNGWQNNAGSSSPTVFTSDSHPTYTAEVNSATNELHFTNTMTWGSVKAALANGENVTLTNDIEDTNNEGALEVPSGKTVTLDLAGFTIDRKRTAPTADGYVIKVVGTLTVQDSSTGKTGKITGGNNSGSGGGVYVNNATSGDKFEMTGGSITGNKAASHGGGVYVYTSTSVFNMSGDAKITDNTADIGGGVYVYTGKFNMSGNAEVSGNTAGIGGGVYVGNDTFNMSGDAAVSNNTATGKSTGYNGGGGVYVTSSAVFTMTGGSITGNKTAITVKSSSIGAYGGGVQVRGATFTMSSGTISGNSCENDIDDNGSAWGGGVYVNSSTNSKFEMTGGSITGNNAGTAEKANGFGGGVFVYGGTFQVSGAPSITDNVVGGTYNDSTKVYAGGTGNNVYLSGSNKITVTGTLTGADASIGVTMATPGVFTNSSNTSYNDADKFSSDMSGYGVKQDDSTSQLKLVITYTVTYNANGGTGTMAAGTAISGVAFTLPANSFTAPTGKQFKAWNIGGTGYAAGSTYTFTDNTTVTALWEDIPAENYTISIAGGISNGTVASDKTSAAEGETVTLTATPSSGYTFGSWTVTKAGGGSVTVADNKFTMPNEAVTVSATFEAVASSTHSVTITSDAHMTASSGSGNQTVAAGSAMTNVIYTADTGYFFPDGYSATENGVTVTRNSVSQITLSGTPTGDVSLSLTAPTQLDSISVSGSTRKTNYTVGDSLDVSGLVIALNDPAAATVNVTADMVSGFNSSTAGTKTLTITYGGKTTTYTVTVNNAATPSRPSYSGGDNSSSTPAPATVTVPVSGDANTVNVTVTISGTTATLRSADIKSALADNKETGTVEIDVGGLDRDITAITIPAGTVSDIAAAVTIEDNATDSLTVKLTDGTVTFDAAAVEAITEQAEGRDLRLNLDGVETSAMSETQQAATADLEVEGVLDVYMTSGSTRISDFKGGSAEIRLPFTPPDGRTAAEYRVWYVAENGALTDQRARYDTSDNCFVFTVTHFSNYVVAYNGCPQDETCPISAFTDADPAEWYHDGVHYVLENGIMSGYGGAETGSFGPNDATSRAMMAQILWNMEGKPVVNYLLTFSDVAESMWYTEAVRWATAENIMNGYGDGLFGPDDAMTREQLVTIVHRYAIYKGVDVSVGEDTNILSYDDAFDVSEWAIPAMQWAVGSGAVGGITDISLNPRDTATRAEIATIMMRYSTEIAK